MPKYKLILADPPWQYENATTGRNNISGAENLDRIRHGWHPCKDARWFWWVLADIIVLLSIAKLEIPKVWRRRPKHLRLTK